jgi:nucleotide-binding universal stress UspA family protein
MQLNAVIALTDLTNNSEQGLRRAAMIAAAHKATLRLMAVSNGKILDGSNLMARLAQRARHYARRFEIRVDTVETGPSDLLHLVEVAGRADLLVMPHGIGPGLASEMLSLGMTSVLVVKKAALKCYASALVAVNLSKPHSTEWVRRIGKLESDARQILFHSLEGYRPPSGDTQDRKNNSIFWAAYGRARSALRELSQVMGAHSRRPCLSVGFGEPRCSIVAAQGSTGVDLVILGGSGCSGATASLSRHTVRQVVAQADSDVLVVSLSDRLRPGALADPAKIAPGGTPDVKAWIG